MQEKDSKRSNPKKLKLIPNSEVREIIRATEEAIAKTKPNKVSETILRLARAYLGLSGAYKDIKKELSATQHSHGSRKDLLKDLIGQLEGRVQNSAEAVLEYEEEIQSLRKQNAGLLRRAQSVERQNQSLLKKLEVERQLNNVTTGEVTTVSQEDYDAQEDLRKTRESYKEDVAAELEEKERARQRKKPTRNKKTGNRFSHSSQGWRSNPRTNQRNDAREAAKVRAQVRAAGDADTDAILELLGE
jgi:hypothetical protein